MNRRDFAKIFALVPLVPIEETNETEEEKPPSTKPPPCMNWTTRSGDYGAIMLPKDWEHRYHPVYVTVEQGVTHIKAMDGRLTMIQHVVHGRVEAT